MVESASLQLPTPEPLAPSDLAALRQLPPALLLKLENLMVRPRPNQPLPHNYSARTSNESEVQTMYKIPHHSKCASGADSQNTYLASTPFSPPHRNHKIRTPTSCDNSGVVQYKRPEEGLSRTIEEEMHHQSERNLVESVVSLGKQDVHHNTVDIPFSSRHDLTNSLDQQAQFEFHQVLGEGRNPAVIQNLGSSSEEKLMHPAHYQAQEYGSRGRSQRHFLQYPDARQFGEPSHQHTRRASRDIQDPHQVYERSERKKHKKERAINLIKKLQAKNYASFTFREFLLRHLRKSFTFFAQQALRMKRVPPGHSRREEMLGNASSIDSSNPLFLNSGSLDIRDILVNYIGNPAGGTFPEHYNIPRLYGELGPAVGGGDISGSTIPPAGPRVYAQKSRTHGFSSSETERANLSRAGQNQHYRKGSLITTPTPQPTHISSARSGRNQSQPAEMRSAQGQNSDREQRLWTQERNMFTPLQDTGPYMPYPGFQNYNPSLQTPLKRNTADEIGHHPSLRLSDFLSLARCQRCNHTQLTLLTNSNNEQLSPTFVEKVRMLIPAAFAFSSDQSTITPDITTATQTAFKQREEHKLTEEVNRTVPGAGRNSPRLTGRRTNPYEESSGKQCSIDSNERDFRNFFLDGHFLSSEKRGSDGRGSSHTPLDTGEMNMFTQLGDELVDSFYKLSDTLGNSQGLLQQGSQGMPPPAALESLMPCSTGRSQHHRNESSSILSSVGEPSSLRQKSFNSKESGNNRRYEQERDSQYPQLPDICESAGSTEQKIMQSNRPHESDMSLVLFEGYGDQSMDGRMSRMQYPRPPSVSSHYVTTLQNSPLAPVEESREGLSRENPFQENEELRMSFSKEQTAEFTGGRIKEETTRRAFNEAQREEMKQGMQTKRKTGEAEKVQGGSENMMTARFKETQLREQKECLSTVKKKDLECTLEEEEEEKQIAAFEPVALFEREKVERIEKQLEEQDEKEVKRFEEKKCLELPVALHLKAQLHLKKAIDSPSQQEEEHSNLASTRRESTERGGEPLRSGRMKPRQPKDPKPSLNSSRDNSVTNLQGTHFYSRSQIHERPHSTNPLTNKTITKLGSKKNPSSISPKPFQIPKSAVQPQTQRTNLKIAGFTRALKKLGTKGPSPPSQGSARSFKQIVIKNQKSEGKIDLSREAQESRDEVNETTTLQQTGVTNSTKTKLASTITSLLGNTTSSNLSGTKKSTAESTSGLGFSGTIKKKTSVGGSPSPFVNETASAHEIDLLFQKKSNSAVCTEQEISKLTENVPSLKLAGLSGKGTPDKSGASQRTNRETMLKFQGQLRNNIFRVKRAS